MRRRRLAITLVGLVALLAPATAQASGSFSGSSISFPLNGAELFYNGDTALGMTLVQGTVTPSNFTGDGALVCYEPGFTPVVATGVAITNGVFSEQVSLKAIHAQVCRLALVPSALPYPAPSQATLFAGPAISVSDQYSLPTPPASGSLYGYDILAGSLTWAYRFGSLGQCPVLGSFSTDPTSLGSYQLLDGNACLLESSGIDPNEGTRSAIQIDGLNAYAPGDLAQYGSNGPTATLNGVSGFDALSYSTVWDANHDTITITETDPLMFCTPPGQYPPFTPGNCPSFTPSGIVVTQTTTLLPGDQVARVTQQFVDTDGASHSLDLLFSQSAGNPASASGVLPGFEFPGQGVPAAHGAPDSFSLFKSGPGNIYVIANSAAAPATSNPIGAITYSQPPTEADFVSKKGQPLATFLMHYATTLPAGGTLTYSWSFSQATSTAGITQLVGQEYDRFATPSLTLSSPASGRTVHTPQLTVSGTASDPVAISSLTVNGQAVTPGSGGAFATTVRLARGLNTITVVATNLGGNSQTATATVNYAPLPCIVPRLRGRNLADAIVAVVAHGCTVGKVKRRASRRVGRGRVIATRPRHGTRHRPGTKVTLIVSSGR